MEPIRVLHIVTYMGRGGLETMLMNYYRNIDRNKIQFDFLVHRDFEADYDKEIELLGGRIYRISRLNPFSKKYLNELDLFFKEHKEYKIVHSHLDCMAGIPLKYAKKNGIPYRIAHAHSSNQDKDLKYPLKLIFKRNIVKYANECFACGQMAGQWMFGGKEFQILNNAIDAKQYIFDYKKRNQVRKMFGIDESAFVVGHVGRFEAVKNHTFLLDVFYELLEKKENSVLFLIGDGSLKDEMKQKCEKLGINKKVIFAGLRDDVSDMLQAMDIFILPSLYEGVVVSGIEAQASSLPCLISEKVPMECEKVKGLVTQIDLAKGAKYWAQKALEKANHKRENTYSAILKSGFDIQQNGIWLTNFYLENTKKPLE